MATHVPSEMHFTTYQSGTGPESLKWIKGSVPTPKKGEVLIRVEAAGVNRPDVYQRKGQYNPPHDASPVLGLEVAGTIVQVDADEKVWKVGDPVCALVHGGGYAEYCVAPSGHCLPIPKGLNMIEAAGIPENYFTVWSNVFMRGKLIPGESILIHGGSSGIGTTAIQLAHAFGARAWVTAGSQAKCKACLDLGAVGAVNYREKDFEEEVKRLNRGEGVHLILDMVAGDYFEKNLRLLQPEGRLVQISVQKGERVTLSLFEMMSKRLTITGSTLRPQSVKNKEKIAQELRQFVWPLFESGKIKVVVDQVYPISRVSDAHHRMENGDHIGKLILSVR